VTPALPTTARPPLAPTGFEQVYRAELGAVTAFFARRCGEPQTVADLTSETFVRAISAYRRFDPAQGSARAWLLGIARHVYFHHLDTGTQRRVAVQRLGGQLVLGADESDELAARIDDQAAGRALLAATAGFPEPERTALELVDIAGLTPREAAQVCRVSAGALRVRLFRARARLRKEGIDDVR
jgi:RNA polymerase sigma factor (sigma-70 family)